MVATEGFIIPKTLEEAAQLATQSDAAIHAGGTDLLPRVSKGLVDRPKVVIDLKRLPGLVGITDAIDEVRIGACTLISSIASDAVILLRAPVLAEAADRIACPQIRNRATIGGNLCNASPAADTAVPLILLDAVIELVSAGGNGVAKREVPIDKFFTGPGATVMERGEFMTHVRFKPLPDKTFTAWDKFGTRPAMEIAVASVGLALTLDEGKVVRTRVGYGSVAPTPMRGRKAEAELMGHSLTSDVIAKCESAARQEIRPITDVRASESYRRQVVGVMLRRMLEEAADAQQG